MTSPGRGTAHLMSAQGVLLVSGFVISIILARGLGPESYGVYGVVISLLGWLERMLFAGIPPATVSLMASDPTGTRGVERTGRLLLILWCLPLFALLWLMAPTLSESFGITNGTNVLRIAAFNVPVMAVIFAYIGILNGRHQFGPVSGIQIIQSVAKVAGVLLLLMIGLSLPRVFIAHVAGGLLPAVFAVLAYPLMGAPASLATMRAIMRIALPLAVFSVALVVLTNISLWQLQAQLTGEAASIGIYVASVNLTKILMVIPTTTSGVLFAALTGAFAKARPDLVAKYIHESGRFALITLTPVCVLLWIDAGPVMMLLYGAHYAEGGEILGILSFAVFAVALFDIHFHALMARGLQVLAAGSLVLLLPVQFYLTWLWIPLAGVKGAALASLVTYSLGAVIAATLTYRIFGYLLKWRVVLRVVIASLVVGAVSLALPVTGILVVFKLAAMMMLYVGLLFAGRELTVHDLKPFALWKSDRA